MILIGRGYLPSFIDLCFVSWTVGKLLAAP